MEEDYYLNKCLFYLKKLDCSLGVQCGHSQSCRRNKLRHYLVLRFKTSQPKMGCTQMKVEGRSLGMGLKVRLLRNAVGAGHGS